VLLSYGVAPYCLFCFEQFPSLVSNLCLLFFTNVVSGIFRAAYSDRQTVYCQELNAYIALPTVPSKYLKWLRQRRAATKEIRNMMLIGRHRSTYRMLFALTQNDNRDFLSSFLYACHDFHQTLFTSLRCSSLFKTQSQRCFSFLNLFAEVNCLT
jgi:hypothetical protein